MFVNDRLHRDTCVECEHPTSARSVDSLLAAVQDHVDFVNAKLDRSSDIHFALQRLTTLAVS